MEPTSAQSQALAERLERVRAAIAAAAARAGRDPAAVTLVGVTKTVDAEVVHAVSRLGLTHVGENRVQEAIAKIAAIHARARPDEPSRLCWHLIGHLQTNKARPALENFAVVESVDSLRLARTLDRLAAARGEPLTVLLEVNVGGEPSKFGFPPADLPSVFPQIRALANLRVQGLMTVAPPVPVPEQARPYFRRLRDLRDRLVEENPGVALPELSMGMSGDFPVAIEEGATLVRIGRAIFGERPAL